MSFSVFKDGQKVLVLLSAGDSAKVSLDGSRIDGTLNGSPVASAGSLEYLSLFSTSGMSGDRDGLATGPATLIESINYAPASGARGKFSVQLSGTRDTSSDADATMAAFVVKSHAVIFDLKNMTQPVNVEIWKTA